MQSDTEYRPIELPVSHLLQNLDQSAAFHAATLSTIDWRPHNFLLWIKCLVENSTEFHRIQWNLERKNSIVFLVTSLSSFSQTFKMPVHPIHVLTEDPATWT